MVYSELYAWPYVEMVRASAAAPKILHPLCPHRPLAQSISVVVVVQITFIFSAEEKVGIEDRINVQIKIDLTFVYDTHLLVMRICIVLLLSSVLNL